MKATRLVPLLIVLLHGCALQVELPSPSPIAPCGFTVADTRPEPAFIYARERVTFRLAVNPPIAKSIEMAVCASPTQSRLAPGTRLVVTEFECQITGLLEMRVAVDLRGRLETPSQAPRELRVSEVAVGYWSRIPAACQGPAERLPGRMATEVLTFAGPSM
jgi:hypothetical protein